MLRFKSKCLMTFEKEYIVDAIDYDAAEEKVTDLIEKDLNSIGVTFDEADYIESFTDAVEVEDYPEITKPPKPRTLKTTNIKNNSNEDNYYLHNGIMAIDIMDLVCDYYEDELPTRDCVKLWTALKYLLRFPFKGQRNSDLNKAIEYIKALEE